MQATKPTAINRFRINTIDLQTEYRQQHHYWQQNLPNHVGLGQSAIFQLDQDLSYIETRYTPSKNLAIVSKIDIPEPRLVVTLSLKGNSIFAGYQGEEFSFYEGYTTITAFNSSLGERQYNADKPILQLRLSMSKRWIDRYFGEDKSAALFCKTESRLLSYRPTSCQAIMASRQLLTCEVPQGVKSVFMHGQAMSILAAELAHLFDEDDYVRQFNDHDKAIASLARDILLTEFKNPPSLAALSKQVGTNQNKLKKLFQHYYNATPYALLSECRMNHAYELLKSRQYQVATVADKIGFNHASNFSSAFIKHFGISPKKVAKTE